MFKAMILLKRRENTTREAFADWWLGQHRPLAEQLPGLQRAVFNLNHTDDPEGYDGISELWFESQSAFEAAYTSEIGKEVAADSMRNVSARERLLVTEHIIKS